MERADELLSFPGMNVAMVGPADLSISPGIPGQFENFLLVSTIDALVAKCNPARRRSRPDPQPRHVEVLA